MWKPKNLDEERPLYLAIADALQSDIAEGRLEPGARMPTQRELARSVGVDLSTVRGPTPNARGAASCRLPWGGGPSFRPTSPFQFPWFPRSPRIRGSSKWALSSPSTPWKRNLPRR